MKPKEHLTGADFNEKLLSRFLKFPVLHTSIPPYPGSLSVVFIRRHQNRATTNIYLSGGPPFIETESRMFIFQSRASVRLALFLAGKPL